MMLLRRHRQRYGGYLVHLGLVALAVGVIGSHFFQQERDLTFTVGQSARVGAYTFSYRGISGGIRDGVQVISTHFLLASGERQLGVITPGERIFPGFEDQPTSVVSITTHGLTDIYAFLSAFQGTGQSSQVSLKVFINPLVPLVWVGGLMMLLGGIACWWPERRRPAIRLREAQTRPAPVEVAV